MSVLDKSSRSSFLVDTGADISVIPMTFLNLKPGQKSPTARPGQRLRAANGSSIDTFGTKTLCLDLSGFQVRHSFRVARVAQPILGADFFRKNSVIIDVGKNCLRLPGGEVVDSVQSHPRDCAAVSQNTYSEVLEQFPAIKVPKFGPTSVPAHGVQHLVPTTGPPVFARARPLFAEKLKVARAQFDKMLKMQIIAFTHGTEAQWQLASLRRFQTPQSCYLR